MLVVLVGKLMAFVGMFVVFVLVVGIVREGTVEKLFVVDHRHVVMLWVMIVAVVAVRSFELVYFVVIVPKIVVMVVTCIARLKNLGRTGLSISDFVSINLLTSPPVAPSGVTACLSVFPASC